MFRKFLVTGATGFLGRTVVSQLVAENKTVHALVMKNDPYLHLLPDEVHRTFGDVCDTDSLDCFFADSGGDSAVIHCAGVVSVASEPGERIYRINVGGTNNVIVECLKHNVGKLVYVSSVHAFCDDENTGVITENSPIIPKQAVGDYAKSKAMATCLAMEAEKDGLDVGVVFPSGLLGPGDLGKGGLIAMLRAFADGKLPFAVKGGYDFADVRDVAKGTVAAAQAKGKKYILSGCYATIKDILQHAASALDIKNSPLYLPLAAAKMAAPLFEKYCIRKNLPLYFTPYSVSVLASEARFNNRAAKNDLDYNPRPIGQTVRDTVLWLTGKGCEAMA